MENTSEQESRILKVTESSKRHRPQARQLVQDMPSCNESSRRETRWSRRSPSTPASEENDQQQRQTSESKDGGELYIESIRGLIREQCKVDEEVRRIKENKNLTFVDKCDAVKSVRSLSKTIEGLIGKEKEKLTEYYYQESQYPRNTGPSMKSSDVRTFERVFNSGSPQPGDLRREEAPHLNRYMGTLNDRDGVGFETQPPKMTAF